jgi:transcriptional regulator with XRE-family HTH domain
MSVEARRAFAARLHEVCDLLDIPEGHGRQAQLGRRLGVSPKAARKWLTGAGWPEMDTAVRIAEMAEVELAWLLQGHGPMRGSIDTETLTVAEAMKSLPTEERRRVLGYLRYEITQRRDWFAKETATRYSAAIDRLAANDADAKGEPGNH